MKIIIPKNKIELSEQFIRRCGYGRIFDRRSGQVSYARRLRGSFYPRLHLYIEEHGDNYHFNLHLDQRATRYKGATAHSGDYDGPIVEQEVQRIKSFINN
jgi:hypothetical protein